MPNSVGLVISGLMVILVGFLLTAIFAGPIIDNFATIGADPSLPSFSGGKSFNDMFVLFYYIFSLIILLSGVVITGTGVKRFATGG